MYSQGVIDGTEDWEAVMAEGPPAKHHIQHKSLCESSASV